MARTQATLAASKQYQSGDAGSEAVECALVDDLAGLSADTAKFYIRLLKKGQRSYGPACDQVRIYNV